MDDILKHAKECYDEVSIAYEREKYYATHPLNEFWGSINLRDMRNMIANAQSTSDIIRGAQRTMMFCVNSPEKEITERAVGWLLNERMERLSNKPWLAYLEESELSLPANNVVVGGKRFNPDFLRCVNLTAEIIEHLGPTHKRPIDIVELGGGLGHLARVLRQGAVARSHVIIDLPETLVFSYCFLRENFPAAVCQWVRPDQEMATGADFYFVPAMLCDKVLGRSYDLFLNTASMGEMTNVVIRQWMEFVQKELDVKYLFTLNRFCNTIHPRLQWRLEENECSVHYDADWTVLNWELEPPYTRCPYIDTRVSRYVQIIALRAKVDPLVSKMRASQYLSDLEHEDWARLWNDGHVMGMRDGPICVDGTMGGTLFKLWELMRYQPSAKACELMIKYLAKITPQSMTPGVPMMIEEAGYYDRLYRELSLVESVRAPS